MTLRVRSYTEMIRYSTFLDRYEYLKLRSSVGEATFGFDRYINQNFYRSTEWRQIRDHIIARDLGRDLGIAGQEIFDRVIIHHMNPMRLEDIDSSDPDILDPEYLVTVSHDTHNAIHFGDATKLKKEFVERQPGDTRLW